MFTNYPETWAILKAKRARHPREDAIEEFTDWTLLGNPIEQGDGPKPVAAQVLEVPAEEVKEKQKAKKDQEKFAVDLDKYLEFCENTCSNFSKDHAAYIKRLNDLNELGCNISLLDTAANGLSAEAGEFMEICLLYTSPSPRD